MRPRHYAGESGRKGGRSQIAGGGFNEAPALRRGKLDAEKQLKDLADELQ